MLLLELLLKVDMVEIQFSIQLLPKVEVVEELHLVVQLIMEHQQTQRMDQVEEVLLGQV